MSEETFGLVAVIVGAFMVCGIGALMPAAGRPLNRVVEKETRLT